MKTFIIILLYICVLAVGIGIGKRIPNIEQPLFITINGADINPDHIVSHWNQDEILHIMTDTKSTFRNGNRDNYYRIKLTKEEMKEVLDMLRKLRR